MLDSLLKALIADDEGDGLEEETPKGPNPESESEEPNPILGRLLRLYKSARAEGNDKLAEEILDLATSLED